MRKSFILILILIMSFVAMEGKGFAQSQFSPIITKMENSLFGIDYKTQNDAMRLKRLEEQVYGQSSSQPISKRVEKLKQDLSADLIGQEIKPKSDTFADESDRIKEDIPKEDSSVNYPIVNKLENQVYKKEFKKLDINKRLANLEQKTFNKVYNDDLNTRVERLKSKLLPESALPEDYTAESFDPDNIFDDNFPPKQSIAPRERNNFDYNSKKSVLDEYDANTDISVPLAAMERSLYQKAYADDTVSHRLGRIETQMFNSSFTQDDPQTRMERITSAKRAQKSSSKYDNNKHSQHMSAAMQIGAILLLVLAAVL